MPTRPRRLSMVLALAALALGCERRSATRNSAGSLDDSAEPRPMGSANVYRFTGVEQSLTDARRAVQEERWGDAIAATDALLRQQPGNSEAQSINHQARLEAPNQQQYLELMKAIAANEVGGAVKHYRQIAEGSLYRDKGRIAYEKLRATYLDNQENGARVLVHAGRCDEAHRTARVASDWFPDARARMDEAASGCHPRGDTSSRTAANDGRTEDKPTAPTLVAATVPPAAVPSEPIAMVAPAKTAAEPPKSVAMAPTVPAPAPAPPPAIAHAPALAPAPGPASARLIREYLQRKVQPAVQRHFVYPIDAEREGLEGVVMVRLSIASSGQLTHARVSGRCPNELLCRAAVVLAQQSSPFPPPPEGLGAQVDVDVRIEYHIE